MNRNLYVDTTSASLVASSTLLQPLVPEFFFGDSLELTVTFLEETGIIGKPLASVSFSGATVELGIGTLGGGAVVTASSWSDNSTPTGSIAVSVTGSPTESAVQTLAFNSPPQSGSFFLTMAGTSGTAGVTASTTLISAPINPSDIQTALAALSFVGTGNVLVSGSSPEFTISFINGLGYQEIAPLELSASVNGSPSKSASLVVSGSTLKNLMTSNASLILEIASISGGAKSTLCHSPVTITPTLLT